MNQCNLVGARNNVAGLCHKETMFGFRTSTVQYRHVVSFRRDAGSRTRELQGTLKRCRRASVVQPGSSLEPLTAICAELSQSQGVLLYCRRNLVGKISKEALILWLNLLSLTDVLLAEEVVHYLRHLWVTLGQPKLLEDIVSISPPFLRLFFISLHFVDVPNHEEHVDIVSIIFGFIFLTNSNELRQHTQSLFVFTVLEFQRSHLLQHGTNAVVMFAKEVGSDCQR